MFHVLSRRTKLCHYLARCHRFEFWYTESAFSCLCGGVGGGQFPDYYYYYHFSDDKKSRLCRQRRHWLNTMGCQCAASTYEGMFAFRMWINPFALLIYVVLMWVRAKCAAQLLPDNGDCRHVLHVHQHSDSVLRRLQCLHFDTAESSRTWDFCIGASLSLGVCEVGCRTKKEKILNKTETINSERKSKIDLHFALCVPNHPNFLHFNLSSDSLLEHPAPQNAEYADLDYSLTLLRFHT